MREKTTRPDRGLYDWVQTLVCSVLAVVLVFTFLVRVVRVDGPSMRETLQDRDLLLVLNGPLCGGYRQGDIVVLRKAGFHNGSLIVKRVIATGGQTVDIDFVRGVVYVDGQALEEPYIREPTFLEEGLDFPVTLEENEVFVMGDNRNESDDSRDPDLGPVDVRSIVGRAVLLAVPGETEGTGRRELSRIGTLH